MFDFNLFDLFNCPIQSSVANSSGTSGTSSRDRSSQVPSSFDLPGNPVLWLSLATVPLLFILLTTKALFEIMQQLGLASEELFRGDRLPILTLFDSFGSGSDQGNE